MNDNEERFAAFFDLQDLVIGESVFPLKKIHKAIQKYPNDTLENYIHKKVQALLCLC